MTNQERWEEKFDKEFGKIRTVDENGDGGKRTRSLYLNAIKSIVKNRRRG